MSKQLLHAAGSDAIVAGLNDRAFAILRVGGGAGPSSSSAVALELTAPEAARDERADGARDAENEEKGDGGSKKGGGDDSDKGGKSQRQKQKQKGRRHPRNDAEENPLEVQSVCCASFDSSSAVWCAVSRNDKTLCLYLVPLPAVDGAEDGDGGGPGAEKVGEVRPAVTYRLPKRARRLAFCSVPPSPAEPSAEPLRVIVAGDLAGDAAAYPVPAADVDDGKNSEKGNEVVRRRLLLGHTASVLTGLNVISAISGQKDGRRKQLILTADRDEKVRVSRFPETHVIRGYLLGHSAFVSTMDAAVATGQEDERTLCVTGSGDGTVRLWNCETCKEVGMVPLVIKKSADYEEREGEEEEDEENEKAGVAEDVEGNEDEEEEEEEEGADGSNASDNGEENSHDQHAIVVPISVALGPNAESVAVARDGVDSVDVHPIPPPPTASSPLMQRLMSLHRKQSLACPSQPLDVRFLSDGSLLALAKEPDYLLRFERKDSGDFEDASSRSPLCTALREAARSRGIVVPTTTLERDEGGGWKLQKNKVREAGDDPDDATKQTGPHWNDSGRRETAKRAEQRRRKRRRERADDAKVAGATT
ncbi:hypothetical protein ACHAWF_007453 [Thalassiosira exigua]